MAIADGPHVEVLRPRPIEEGAPSIELRVLKGDPDTGQSEVAYPVPEVPGMVVLDAVHYVQRNLDTDLACRWNCKAAKCGSCSAEINGRPGLMCKTRIDELGGGPVTVHPLKAFPLIKDLVTDVSRNYEVDRRIPPFTPPPDDPTPWTIPERDLERLYEFRKCIECFLCQDVCHILRDHDHAARFHGPRYLVRTAFLEMHPKDTLDRRESVRREGGIGFCNITKCCTEVCPEHIHITDNAIIPLKERVADRHWDPVRWVGRAVFGERGNGGGRHGPIGPM
ncbi:MAG TPA: succinate dehydrogenase/fumarate reductase iron-sulfur subunit [Candidatus Dormibacteraeota bacterium]|nr:succinate dehydrogenase/fumarate reductase iron-sulfur subunit [Candidatus Dormibacteraeota bacterium]